MKAVGPAALELRRGLALALSEALGAALTRLPYLALAVLLAALASPQGAPTAEAIIDPASHRSAWNVRVGPLNLLELGAAAVGLVWLARVLIQPPAQVRARGLDDVVVVLLAVFGLLQLLALARGIPDPEFLLFDLEHLVVPLVGYALVRLAAESVPVCTIALLAASVLALRAAELVVVQSLQDGTNFGTALGTEALLITEDSLLVAMPILLGWGALVDGRLRRPLSVLIVAGVLTAIAVDLISLRRGALLFILATLIGRSLVLDRRRLLGWAATVVAVTGLLVWAGPLRTFADEASFAARSTLFMDDDNSTRERRGELASFAANLEGADWLLGRGAGSTWIASAEGPAELGTFGAGESQTRRIGWHVYGLDYAYKFGFLGLAALVAAGFVYARRIRRAHRAGDRASGYALSLALAAPAFAVFAWTNLRLGLAAGVCFALVGLLIDQPDDERDTARS